MLPKRSDFAYSDALLRAWDASAKVLRRLNKDRAENPHLRGAPSQRELIALNDAACAEASHLVPLGLGHHLNQIVSAQLAKLR